MNVSIQAVAFSADQDLINVIEKKMSKLEQYHDRITGVEVYLKLDNKSTQIKDKIVSIRCQIPGVKALFSEETGKKFEPAVDKAITALRRQIKKHKEKMQQH